MKYYHMTSLDRLICILKEGLVPKNENNSKLIRDTKNKVFFSEGYEGAIALFADFNIVYDNVKAGKLIIADKALRDKIFSTNSLEEYLQEGVYLVFNGDNILNERNFENGCTDKNIKPEKLKVCVLKNIDENTVSYSRFDVIKYMMSKVDVKDIKYYGVEYEGSPDSDAATERIQTKVFNYYNNHKSEIDKYRNGNYEIIAIPLDEFIKSYIVAKATEYISKTVTVKVDRSLGSNHPKHGFVYPVNYGYIPGTISGDGEELDAYILGVNEPLDEFTGRVIAVIHRTNDDDDKLIVVPDSVNISNDEIRKKTYFQEQYFESVIIR